MTQGEAALSKQKLENGKSSSKMFKSQIRKDTIKVIKNCHVPRD